MGSDGTALRFADRVAHANGTVIANVDGQFWHSQLTSTLQFFDHTVYGWPSSVYPSWPPAKKIAHIYLRVSTDEQ